MPDTVDGPAHHFSRRQNEIVALLREAGRVGVDELATHFDVSPQTIRRDLNEMSEARVITRVHGGAIVASSVENLAYDARKLVAQQHKRLIGEAAARLIPDHSSLFINIGTTTEEVARALAGRSGLLVITNNLNVATELYRNRAIDVIITGGSVRPTDGGIVGATTVELIRQFRVDTAVIGISAIDEDGTLLDFDIREVHVSRAIIENARRVILVTDSSKFARSAPARLATLADIDILVTDHLPSPAIAALCRTHEVEVVETGGRGNRWDRIERSFQLVGLDGAWTTAAMPAARSLPVWNVVGRRHGSSFRREPFPRRRRIPANRPVRVR